MRILHVDLGHDMRGGQWQVLALVDKLRKESVLLAREGSPLLRAAIDKGITAMPFSMGAVLKLKSSCDIVHAHDARAHTLMACYRSTHLVVSRRVAFPIRDSFLSRWKYGRADVFIAVSKFVKQQLVAGGVPPEKVEVVYDGVEIPAARAHGDLIVAPATEDPMKGSALVREAAVLGGFEVHFSQNLPHDLQHAAVLLYITHAEGLGSAALLAMASGVPVVASRVGGLPEIVQNGKTGVLTENQPSAIVDALKAVLAQQESMSIKARQLVAEKFTTSKMVSDTVKIYRRMLA
jgi:glycosyltransferase involved in cell wall biosynthesis